MRYTSVYLRFPGGKSRCLSLSYDDCVQQDEQLCDLMEAYGIAGTFNVNSGLYVSEDHIFEPGQIHRHVTQKKAAELYSRSPLFEVATHSYTHPYLQNLPPVQITQQIMEDRLAIESQFGCVCRGHAYPFGTYNQQVIDCLRACGIAYARTIQSTGKFSLPEDFLLWHPTCHHRDSRLMELAEQFLAEPCVKQPRLFYLWGHTFEFEEKNNWHVIENFFKRVSGHEDIWYATNIQICDYICAFRQLIWNAAGDRIDNPTATDLWIKLGSKTHCIKAGQTLFL